MTTLSGRVALVTGASHGTGVDVARDLARAGARVAVHYRSDRAAGEDVAAAIRAEGGEAEVFTADVARADDVRRLVAQVRARLGAPGIVVNNAGPFNDAAFCDLREADWDYVMNANLKAVYLTAQLVAPDMQAAGWGRIVNIGATSGLVRSHGVYGLAKAALLHLTQSLALELAPAVTVNALVPSQIASARTDGRRWPGASTPVRMRSSSCASSWSWRGTPPLRLSTKSNVVPAKLRDYGPNLSARGKRALPRRP